MATQTVNYGFNKPNPGGDDNAWGTLLNQSMDLIDGQIKTNKDAVDASIVVTTTAVGVEETRNTEQDALLVELETDVDDATSVVTSQTAQLDAIDAALVALETRVEAIEAFLGIV